MHAVEAAAAKATEHAARPHAARHVADAAPAPGGHARGSSSASPAPAHRVGGREHRAVVPRTIAHPRDARPGRRAIIPPVSPMSTRVSGSSYEQVAVAAPPAVAVERLREALRARGLAEYAVVDHGHDMVAAGAPSHPAWTLVFGNPAAGEKLLARDLAAAVDIPLRLAVIATGRDTSAVVIRPMATLLPEPLGDLGEAFDRVLRSLASEAAAGRP
jgi:uncharacterized protein (DUF302 family)